MTPVSQLLLRNLAGIAPADGLMWINPPADDAWRQLSEQARCLSLWCQDYACWKHLDLAGAPADFGDFPVLKDKTTRHYILTLPRSKKRLGMLLDFVCSVLPENGIFWLAGENRAGIKSSSAQLEKRFRKVLKLDNARHCCLFEASGAVAKPHFQADDHRLEWRLEESLGNLTICSWPGVFSHGTLDAGTRMLLEQLPARDVHGKVLDFACGCGVISARLAMLFSQARITMTDIDALAIKASEYTMEANDFTANILPGDGFKFLQERFDMIVTNPPFHQGVRTDTGLGMQLLDPVRNFLNPRGQLLLVANRHIPYRKWLDGVFGSHEVLASNDRTSFSICNGK